MFCRFYPINYNAVLYKSQRSTIFVKTIPLLTIHQEIVDTKLQSHLMEHPVDGSGLNGFTVDPFHIRERAFDGPTSSISMRFRPFQVSGIK